MRYRETQARKRMSDRFWSKVENSSGASCWQWLGYVNDQGYGCFDIRWNGKRRTGHAPRIAWELRRGPIPEAMHVLHHCDNPGCCNVSHLFIGDNAINIADKVAKGRQVKGERNGNHKLTWDDIDWIHVYANQLGWPNSLLAECHGVDPSVISNVLCGRRWHYPRSNDDRPQW